MTAEAIEETDPFAPPPPLPVPPGGAAPPGACSLRGGVLRVDGLAVADPDAVAGARRALAAGGPPGLDAWARAAVSVGARAISTAGATAGLDDLADRLGRLADAAAKQAADAAETVRAAVDRAADPRDGTVASSVREAMAGLASSVDEMLAGEDSPVRMSVARAVRAATDDAAGRVERALASSSAQVQRALSPADPAGPVGSLRRDYQEATEALRRDLGGQLAAVRELVAASGAADAVMRRTAVKGGPFEEAAVAAVVDAAAPGDLVEATGTARGAGPRAGRQGDAVVAVDPSACHGLQGVRVAVECKDASLSPAGWARALDEAAASRQAAAALGVCMDGRMPGRASVLVLSPTRIVVALDPGGDPSLLRAAVHLVRAAAVEAALAGAVPDVDRAALAAAVRQAAAELEEWQRIDRALAAARRGLDDLAAACERVRGRVGAALAAAARLLGPATGQRHELSAR